MGKFSFDNETASVRPYSAIAPLYDRIMSHVDYDAWGNYLLSLCSSYAGSPGHVLELGCGTGSLTFRLNKELRCPYLATDYSQEMLEVARTKAGHEPGNLSFAEADFRNLRIEGAFDLVVLAYDGLNYLLEREEIVDLLRRIASLLNPGGVFLFDQSTPANSVNNLEFFDDRWESDEASYVRASRYDANQRLHTTQFDIRIGDEWMREVHFQRAYAREEMELILKLSSLRVEGCFDAFSNVPATGESERIQWVLSKPDPPTNPAIG